MPKLDKDELEILIYDKYPFGPIGVYESHLEKEYPPTKYIVPKPKYDPGSPFECYWEYYEPFVLEFFIKKATEVLDVTGSLDEIKDRNYSRYSLTIEAEIEGLGGPYEEEFSYDFTNKAEGLLMIYQINKQLFS